MTKKNKRRLCISLAPISIMIALTTSAIVIGQHNNIANAGVELVNQQNDINSSVLTNDISSIDNSHNSRINGEPPYSSWWRNVLINTPTNGPLHNGRNLDTFPATPDHINGYAKPPSPADLPNPFEHFNRDAPNFGGFDASAFGPNVFLVDHLYLNNPALNKPGSSLPANPPLNIDYYEPDKTKISFSTYNFPASGGTIWSDMKSNVISFKDVLDDPTAPFDAPKPSEWQPFKDSKYILDNWKVLNPIELAPHYQSVLKAFKNIVKAGNLLYHNKLTGGYAASLAKWAGLPDAPSVVTFTDVERAVITHFEVNPDNSSVFVVFALALTPTSATAYAKTPTIAWYPFTITGFTPNVARPTEWVDTDRVDVVGNLALEAPASEFEKYVFDHQDQFLKGGTYNKADVKLKNFHVEKLDETAGDTVKCKVTLDHYINAKGSQAYDMNFNKIFYFQGLKKASAWVNPQVVTVTAPLSNLYAGQATKEQIQEYVHNHLDKFATGLPSGVELVNVIVDDPYPNSISNKNGQLTVHITINKYIDTSLVLRDDKEFNTDFILNGFKNTNINTSFNKNLVVNRDPVLSKMLPTDLDSPAGQKALKDFILKPENNAIVDLAYGHPISSVSPDDLEIQFVDKPGEGTLGRKTIQVTLMHDKGWTDGVLGPVNSGEIVVEGLVALSNKISSINKSITSLNQWRTTIWPDNSLFYEDWKSHFYSENTLSSQLKTYIDKNISRFVINPNLNGVITSMKEASFQFNGEDSPIGITVTYQGLVTTPGSVVGQEDSHTYTLNLKKSPTLTLRDMLDKGKLLEALANAYNGISPQDKNDINKVNAAINAGLKNSVLQQLKDYPNKVPLPQSMINGLNNANPSVDFADGILNVGSFPAGPQTVAADSFDLFSPPDAAPANKYVTKIRDTSLNAYKNNIWTGNDFFTDDWLDETQHKSLSDTLQAYMNNNLDTFLINKLSTRVKSVTIRINDVDNKAIFDVVYQGIAILNGDKVANEVTREYTISLRSTASVLPTLGDILNKPVLKKVAIDEIAKIPESDQSNIPLVDSKVSAALKQEAKKEIVDYANTHALPKWLKEALKAADPLVSYSGGYADIPDIPVSSTDNRFSATIKGLNFQIFDSNEISSIKPIKSLDPWKNDIWKNNHFFVDDWSLTVNKEPLQNALKQYITNNITQFINNPVINTHHVVVNEVTINVDKGMANADVTYGDLIMIPGATTGVTGVAHYTVTLVETPILTYDDMVSLPTLQKAVETAVKGVPANKITDIPFVNGVISNALAKSVKDQVNKYGATATLPKWMNKALSTATPTINYNNGSLTINALPISDSGFSQTIPQKVFDNILNTNGLISRIKDVDLNPIKEKIWLNNSFFLADWENFYSHPQLQEALANYINTHIAEFVSNPLSTSTSATNVAISIDRPNNSASIDVTYNGLAIMDDAGNLQTSVLKKYSLRLVPSPLLTIQQMVNNKKLKDDIFAAVSKLPEADKHNDVLLNEAINKAAKDSVVAQIRDFAKKNVLPNNMKNDLGVVIPEVTYTDGTVTVGEFVAGDRTVASGDFIIIDSNDASSIKDVDLRAYRTEIWPGKTIFYSDWNNIYTNQELSDGLLNYINSHITTFIDKPGWSTAASNVTLTIDHTTKKAIFEVTYDYLNRPAGSALPTTEVATYYLPLDKDPTLNITLNKPQFVDSVNNVISKLPDADKKDPTTLQNAAEIAGENAIKQQLKDYANSHELPQSMKDALINALPNVTVDAMGNAHVDDIPVNDQIVSGFDASLSNGKNTSWINNVNLDVLKEVIWKTNSVNKFFTSDWANAIPSVKSELLKYINTNINTFVTNPNLIPSSPSQAISVDVDIIPNNNKARIVVTYSNIVSFPYALYGHNETHEYWVNLKANPKISFDDIINGSQIKDAIAKNPDVDPNIIVHDLIIGNPIGVNGQIHDWVEANRNNLPNAYIDDILGALSRDEPAVAYSDGIITIGSIVGTAGNIVIEGTQIDLNASGGYTAMWIIFFILILLAIILVIGKLIHDKRSYDEHNDRQHGKHLL